MTDQQDDERRRFEVTLADAWRKVEGRNFYPDIMFKRFAIGSYEIPDIESRWQGWQMARSMAPVVTEAMVERAAHAVKVTSVCGLNLNGEHVFCDDPRAPAEIQCAHCDCRDIARACLTAALSPHGERVDG